jgi:hypothetical protein
MPNYFARLQAKVAARNHNHVLALSMLPAILEACRPFIGKKVKNADGTLAKAFLKTLPILPHASNGQAWYQASNYSLTVDVKVSEQFPEPDCGCTYAESTQYLGDLADGILTKVYDMPTGLRADYTAEEIAVIRKSVQGARSILRDLENKLVGFGEYEN